MNFYIGVTILLLFSFSSQARKLGGIAGSPLDSSDNGSSQTDQSQLDASSSSASKDSSAGDIVDPPGNLVSPWSEWMKLKAPPAAFLKPKKNPFPFLPGLSPPVSSAEELAASAPWAQWTKLKTATAAASIPSLPAAPPPSISGEVPAVSPWAAWTSLKAPSYAVPSTGPVSQPAPNAASSVVAPWTAWAQLKTATAAGKVPSVTSLRSTASTPLASEPSQKAESPATNPSSDPTASIPKRPATMEEYLEQLVEKKGSPVSDQSPPEAPVTLNASLSSPSILPSQVPNPFLSLPPASINPFFPFNPYILTPPVAGQPVGSSFPYQFPASNGMYPGYPYLGTVPGTSIPPTPPNSPAILSNDALLEEEEEALEPALLEYLKTLGIKVPEASSSSMVAPASPGIPGSSPFAPNVPSPSTNTSTGPSAAAPIPLEAAEDKLLLKWAKKIFNLQKNSSWVPTKKASILESAWKEWVDLHNTTAISPVPANTSVPVVDKESLVAWLAEMGVFPLETKKMAELVKWIEELEKPAAPAAQNPPQIGKLPAPSEIPPGVLAAVIEILPKAPPAEKLKVAAWMVAKNVTIPSPLPGAVPPAVGSPIPPNLVDAINAAYPSLPPDQKLQIASWVVANNATRLPPPAAAVAQPVPSALPSEVVPPIPTSVVNTIQLLYPTAPADKKLQIASWIVANNITLPPVPPNIVSPSPPLSPLPPALSPISAPPGSPAPIPPSVVAAVNALYPSAEPEQKLAIASWIVSSNLSLPTLSPTPPESTPPLQTSIPPSVMEAVETLYPTLLPEKQLEIASWIAANNVSFTAPPTPTPSAIPRLSPQPADAAVPLASPVLPPLASIPPIPPSVVDAVNSAYPSLPPVQKLQIAAWMVKNNATPPTGHLPSAFAGPVAPVVPPTGVAPRIPPAVVNTVEALYPTAPAEKKLQIASWLVANNITLPVLPSAFEVTSPSSAAQSSAAVTVPPTPSLIPTGPLTPFLAAIQEVLPTLPEEKKAEVENWLKANNIPLPPLQSVPLGPVEPPVISSIQTVHAVYLPYPPPGVTSPIVIPEKLSPFKAEIEGILLRGPPDIQAQLITWLAANNVSVLGGPAATSAPPTMSPYPIPSQFANYLYPGAVPTGSPYPMVSPPAPGVLPTENPMILPLLEQLTPVQFKALLQQVLENCNKSKPTVMVARSSNSRKNGKNRKSHHRNTKEDVDNSSSQEVDKTHADSAEEVVSAMRRALYPDPPAGIPEPQSLMTPPPSSKPSKLDFVPQEFWDMVPTVAPNTSLIDPGYWAAKKSMFISKLFDALARVTLNYTNSAISTTTEDPKQLLQKKIDTQLLSNAARSVQDTEEEEEEESAETSTDDEDLINSEEPANLPKAPENPLHKLFKFGVQKTILSDVSTTPPNSQSFPEPPPTTVAPPPKTTPGLDKQKELLDKLKSVLKQTKKKLHKSKKQKSKPKKARGSTTTESPIDFEALAKALLVQPSK